MQVTVYSTKTCPYCVKVKQWLTDHAVEFTDIYIDRDAAAMQQMIELSGQMSVPVTTVAIDETVHLVLGYDEAKFRELLRV